MLRLTRIVGESLLVGPVKATQQDTKPRTVTIVVCRVAPDELQLLISTRRSVRAVALRPSQSAKVTDQLSVAFVGMNGKAAEIGFTDATPAITPVWRSELLTAEAVRV